MLLVLVLMVVLLLLRLRMRGRRCWWNRLPATRWPSSTWSSLLSFCRSLARRTHLLDLCAP